MSRLKNLTKYLSAVEAVSFYLNFKFRKGSPLNLSKLIHPFFIRNNPFDYATFEEVILREEYKIDLNYEPKTIVDAGANIGLTAIFFANIYPNSQIISIEPDADNYAVLKVNAKKYKNITTKHCGIWSHEAYLKVVDNGMGNNSFTVKETQNNQPGSINSVSIQSIMKENDWKMIDLLKIDIEGSEKIIFGNNFNEWLPFVRTIVIELHDSMNPGASKAVFKAISNYNFSCDIKGENLVFKNCDLK
jgi:FkbM family methyltransferase